MAVARNRMYRWLPLGVPFIFLLWVPFYNAREPYLWGIPYFYWYQFAWMAIGSLLTFTVYRWTMRR